MTTNFASWSLLHMKVKNTLLSGALWLGIGTFIAKILGAVYRIPLTNKLGGLGLGLYQMVFPVYALLLDFSGAGLPSALSRIIAMQEKKDEVAKRFLINSIKLFFVLGILASFFMAIFSTNIARLQGNESAKTAYLFLSPAVVIVSIISCFRGYFQAYLDMRPTAVSQIIEQFVKLIFGLIFINIFMPNIPLSVAGATLAITLSEVVALLYLYLKYKRFSGKKVVQNSSIYNGFIKDAKIIIKTTLPITLVGIMLPLSHVIDSFLIINILRNYTDSATALYGLLSGVVMTVINLPVSVCYGISTVAIPSVSSSKTQKEINSRIKKVISLTFVIALPCTIFLCFFAPFAINLLFSNLPIAQKSIATTLLIICAPCVLFLSLVQSTNAILIGIGKLYTPVKTLGVGIIIKTILNLILLSNKKINIYGSAVAIIACYFSACLINLILIIKQGRQNESKAIQNRQFACQK